MIRSIKSDSSRELLLISSSLSQKGIAYFYFFLTTNFIYI